MNITIWVTEGLYLAWRLIPLFCGLYFLALLLAIAPLEIPILSAMSRGVAAAYPLKLEHAAALGLGIAAYGWLSLVIQELVAERSRPFHNFDLLLLLFFLLVLSAAYLARNPLSPEALISKNTAFLRELSLYCIGLVTGVMATLATLRLWPRINALILLLYSFYFLSCLLIEKPELYLNKSWLSVVGSLYGVAILFSMQVLWIRDRELTVLAEAPDSDVGSSTPGNTGQQ